MAESGKTPAERWRDEDPIMNEQERSELERLKQRQTRLAQELAQLSTHLNLLEQRLNLPQPAAPAQVAVREVAEE